MESIQLLQVVTWALLTGGITGGAWVAIVLKRRQHELEAAQRRLAELEPSLRADFERRLDPVDELAARLAEVEERLDFTERLLSQRRDAERLGPPAS